MPLRASSSTRSPPDLALLDFMMARAHKARPMSLLVKICGIDRVEAADAAIAGGADFCGLNFHPHSPRFLKPDAAHVLADRLRNRTRVVVLLCDPGDEQVASAISVAKPDFLQLHGDEPPARLAHIRSRFGISLIKALPVADNADFVRVASYEPVADMLLFDAKAPPAALRPGGHGAAFDWTLLRGRRFQRPWLLAGGLTPENVARAVAVSGARAVDVSSGVEGSPGQKSPDLIRAFIANARASAHIPESQT